MGSETRAYQKDILKVSTSFSFQLFFSACWQDIWAETGPHKTGLIKLNEMWLTHLLQLDHINGTGQLNS